MPDVSPTKWHLAHTTWFFETFILREWQPDFSPFDDDFHYLFNSYYEAEGPRHRRPERGLLSRPSLDHVIAYRHHVDHQMSALLSQFDTAPSELADLIVLGCQHEQQHQELILTDIKHVLSKNPLKPAYADSALALDDEPETATANWLSVSGGAYNIGADGGGFHFDHEGPRHKTLLDDFRIADRLVTNADYMSFMDDGGYGRPEFWLSQGWDHITEHGWTAPVYWQKDSDGWLEFSHYGLHRLHPAAPVCHLSYFEADAFARWAGARLPTEQEWEVACALLGPEASTFSGSKSLRPLPVPASARHDRLHQVGSECWEWTASAFSAYPRFKPNAGAIGEYNGKFMCGQFVLRGGSCLTPQGHSRRSYRNFFPPDARWQMTGLRLAMDNS